MIRKSIFIIALVAMVLISTQAFSAPAAETTTGPVTLEYWNWNPSSKDMVEGIIAKFEGNNPGIQVELTAMVPSDYWTKMRVMANQGQLPDAFEMSSGFIEKWANDGFLYDISDYVNSDINSNEFFMSLINSAKSLAKTDEYYALPYALVMPVMFFNKDRFDANNLSYPDETWTWDGFLDAAKRLTRDTDSDGETDQWGHYFYGRYAQIEPWIYANDGRLINRSTMKFDPNEAAIETLEFLIDLVRTEQVAPEPKIFSEMDTRDVFAQGISAMFVDGSWNIEYMRDNVGDEFAWGIAPLPAGPSSTRTYVYGWSDFVTIGESTNHPDEAWKLIKFVSGEGLTLENYSPGKIPSYKKLALDPAFLEKGKMPTEKNVLLDLAADRTLITSFTKSWSEWRGYGPAEAMGFNAVIDAALNGDLTANEALQLATKNVNAILDREYR